MKKDLVSEWDKEVEREDNCSKMIVCPMCMGVGKLLLSIKFSKFTECPTCQKTGMISELYLKVSMKSRSKLST